VAKAVNVISAFLTAWVLEAAIRHRREQVNNKEARVFILGPYDLASFEAMGWETRFLSPDLIPPGGAPCVA